MISQGSRFRRRTNALQPTERRFQTIFGKHSGKKKAPVAGRGWSYLRRLRGLRESKRGERGYNSLASHLVARLRVDRRGRYGLMSERLLDYS